MQHHPVAFPPSRARLASVLRAAREVVSVEVTSTTLGIDRREAAKALSRWQAQGWLRRVGHGLYVPVPLDLAGSEQVVPDPWVLVPTLFGQCYIGGWTAAHHWELTEQLFNEILVFTTRRISEKRVVAQGAAFALHGVNRTRLFGLKTLWRDSTKIAISDPARAGRYDRSTGSRGRNRSRVGMPWHIPKRKDPGSRSVDPSCRPIRQRCSLQATRISG